MEYLHWPILYGGVVVVIYDATFLDVDLTQQAVTPGAGTFLEAAFLDISELALDLAAPFLTAQTPAPGAVGIAQNSNIAFTVQDTSSQITQSTVQVTVDQGAGPVPSATNGVVVSPFNGAAASISSSGNGYAVVLDPTTNMAEQSEVTVRVQAQDAIGNALDGSYAFTTGDQTAPSATLVTPTSGATGVSPNTHIVLDLLDLGTGINLASAVITINEGSGYVPVYGSGSFSSPYNGAASAVTAVANGHRVTIDKTTQLAGTQLVEVRTVVADAAANSAPVTHSFTTTAAGTIATPITIENKGGGPVDLAGTIAAGTYRITVTGTGQTPDPAVYNGNPGSGGQDVVFVDQGAGVTKPSHDVYLPPLPVGGPYTLTLSPVPTGGSAVTPAVVTVVPETWDSRTFEIRRPHPPRNAAGPRSPRTIKYPQD